MGFFDRVGKIASGFGGALQSPFGLVKDLATAPWRDEEDFDGFFNTIHKRGVERGGQFLGNLFGPDEGVGALIGGLPEGVVREPANKVFEGLEFAYREGVAEPLSTAKYVSNQSDPLKGGNLGALFDTRTWSQGYERAQTTSPGQSFALDLLGADLGDDEERQRVQDSAFFKPVSGSMDLALRLFADPTVVGGKAAAAVRTAKVVKPITSKTDMDKVLGSNRFEKFNNALEGKTAGEIRDQFFPNDVNGAALSSALADAGDAQTRAQVIRLAMGDRQAIKQLYAERADIAGRMERLIDDKALLRSLDDDNFMSVNTRTKPAVLDDSDESFIAGPDRDPLALDEDFGAAARMDEMPSELERTEMEIKRLYDEEDRTLRAEAIIGQIRNEPRYRRLDEARVAVTRSQFYQKSPLAAPVRMTFNMRPPRMVDLNDPAGDVVISQYARKAGLTKDEQDVWRSRYMAVNSPEGRSAIALEMEDYAITRMAEDLGLTRADVDKMMTTINKGRASAQQVMKSRVYDGEGRSRLRFKDDATGELHDYPLLVSQTANVLPLGDIEKTRKALERAASYRARFGKANELPDEVLTAFNQIWKPTVLLRVGWPIRVVMDEQMRIMGKIGVLAQLKNVKPGLENKVGNSLARATAVATRGIDETTGELMDPKKAAALAPQSRIGFGKVEVGDYEIPAVFGDDVANPTAAYNLTASKPAFERAFSDPEAQQLNELRRRTADYASVHPVENAADYGSAWLNAVNEQIGRDPLARIFLKGGDTTDALNWLHTAEGREHLRRLPLRRNDLDDFVGAVQDQVESYTMGNPDIMKAALNQRARMDDLIAIAPDAAMRPIVHGEILSDALGRGIVREYVGEAVQKLYHVLGSIPSDTLSRHPFADHMYRAEAARLVDILDSQARREGRRLDAQDLALVEKRSREYAISETRKLLYDLSEQSDMAHLLRFVSPFYSAWQETMTRWAGIAIENPAYAMQLRQVWGAPEKAGIITDENGNPVSASDNEGDEITLPDGTKSTIGRERLITLPVPKWAKDVMGLKGVRTQGEVRFNKKSFNMILQGNPGVGVPVQMPVNEIVKHRPELADSMRFILPFGPSQSKIDMLMPATARRVAARSAGEEDRVFRNSALRIYFDKVVDYNTGKRSTQPTWDEAMKDARAFYNVRAVASWVSPAAPGFRSPYQPYIDAYRRLRAEDLETADQRFLDMYGEEFFPLTQSFTKSADGVPPTVEAFTARSKYKDLIEASPELGSFIIGAEGAGEYANAIYQSQLANKVAPGSTTNQRYALSFEEVKEGPNTRLGWIEYRKVADLIDAERIERGLPNLQVKAAEDLAMLKRAMVEKLAEKYPEWYSAFGVVDRNAQAKRLVAMRAVAYDPRMEDRPDMKGVRTYFDVRAVVRRALEERAQAGGSSSLDASGNRDLALIWETLTAKIVEQNLAFSDTFYRYLERDDLSAA